MHRKCFRPPSGPYLATTVTIQRLNVPDLSSFTERTNVINQGAGLQLNGLNIVPSEFDISFDNFRTTRLRRLIWRDGDLSEQYSKAKSSRATVSLTG